MINLNILIHKKTEIQIKTIEGIASKSGLNKFNVVDSDKIDQALYVVIDESYSMTCPFDQGYNRFDATRQLVEAFSNKAITLQNRNIFYGLISFENKVNIRSDLTPYIDDGFTKAINKIDPNGSTALFSGIMTAAKDLVNNKNKLPNALLRILVITDGLENSSNEKEIEALPKYIVDNKIRIDSIVISNEIDSQLYGLTKLSGGVFLCPSSINEGLKYFEDDNFINSQNRIFDDFGRPKKMNEYIDEDVILGNKRIQPDTKINSKKQTIIIPEANIGSCEYITYINRNIEQTNPENHIKRLMRCIRELSISPDSDIKVYPLVNNITNWRVLIRSNSNIYGSGWWYLYLSIDDEYPNKPPNIIFAYPPYHPNISENGNICLKEIHENYDKRNSIKKLLISIKMLINEPNYNEPIDIQHHMSFIGYPNSPSNPETINRIKQTVSHNSKPDYNLWINEWKIQEKNFNMPPEFEESLKKYRTVPDNYLCSYSKEIMEEPVFVEQENKHYDRKSLQLLHKDNGYPTDERLKNDISDWKKQNNWEPDN